MPKALAHPRFLPAHVDRLLALSQSVGGQLSPQAKKRLKVLLGLAAGDSYAQIEDESGISGPGLRLIRRQVENGDLPEMIRDFEQMEARLVARAQASPSKRRGRPSTASLRSLRVTDHANDDVVIELIYLQLSSEMSVAVFGACLPPGPSKANDIASPLERTVKGIIRGAIRRAAELPKWTEFPMDLSLGLAFQELRRAHGHLVKPWVKATTNLPETLDGMRRSPRWTFYPFTSGDDAAADRCLAALLNGSHEDPERWPVSDFFQMMEGFAYQLRTTCNLHGLFPTLRELHTEVADQMTRLFVASHHREKRRILNEKIISHPALEIRRTQADIREALQAKLGVSTVLAHSGYSLTFSHDAWRRRGAGEEGFPVAVDSTRPKVLIQPLTGLRRRARLFYSPVPGLEYELAIRLNNQPEIIERRIHEALRGAARRTPFEYHIRLRPGQATSSYPDWIFKPGTAPPVHARGAELMGHAESARLLKRAAYRVERTHDVWGTKSGNPTKFLSLRPDGPIAKPRPIALVGLARQFFSSFATVHLKASKTLEANGDCAKLEEISIGEETFDAFVFCCSQIPRAIDRAFRNNVYGDALARLRRWKQDIGKGIDTDLYQLSTSAENDEWLLWNVAIQSPEIVPPYHFTKAELMDFPHKPKVRARLAARQEAEIELWMGSAIEEDEDGRVRYPGYDADVERRRLYKNFDADFLLRHVGPEDWTGLTEAAASVVSLGNDFLRTRYSSSGVDWFPTLAALLPPEWAGFLNFERIELESWVDEALNQFRAFPRVLRDVVENVQRCVLAETGLSPVVVYPVKQLIAAWKKYLRKRLQPRYNAWCEQDHGEKTVTPDPVDSQEISENFKKNTSEPTWDHLSQWEID